MMDVPRFPGGPNASPGSKMPGGGFVNVSPSSAKPLDLPNYGGCARGDNVPLNPNCTGAMGGNPKVKSITIAVLDSFLIYFFALYSFIT